MKKLLAIIAILLIVPFMGACNEPLRDYTFSGDIVEVEVIRTGVLNSYLELVTLEDKNGVIFEASFTRFIFLQNSSNKYIIELSLAKDPLSTMAGSYNINGNSYIITNIRDYIDPREII